MCDGLSCTTPLQLIQMVAGLATVGIAAIVAFVTFQQWKTNQATLREKLFDRRFEVFRGTQYFLSMLSNNNDALDNDIWTFAEIYQRSRFLFGTEVSDYLKEMLDRGFEVQFQKRVIASPQDYEDHISQIGKYSENMRWSYAQLDVMYVVFAAYLSFERAK